jgi:hypothetical protein
MLSGISPDYFLIRQTFPQSYSFSLCSRNSLQSASSAKAAQAAAAISAFNLNFSNLESTNFLLNDFYLLKEVHHRIFHDISCFEIYVGGMFDILNRNNYLFTPPALFVTGALYLLDHAGNILCGIGDKITYLALFAG